MASSTEKSFLADILDGKKDSLGVYADYLEENGRSKSAELVRKGWDPVNNWSSYSHTSPKTGPPNFTGGIIASGLGLGLGPSLVHLSSGGPSSGLIFPE